MNNRIIVLAILIVLLLPVNSCNRINNENREDVVKKEIMQTEEEFANMAKQKDIAEAFLYYAADSAVLFRNNSLIKGKEKIKKYFDEQTLKEIKLDWKPDFVDVSKSGDFAYSYGYFSFSAINADGKRVKSNGIFHTIWKKQKDGKWKYVWD